MLRSPGGFGARPSPDLPEVAWVVALASLPDLGPARLRALLGLGAPEEVWSRVRRGAVGSAGAPRPDGGGSGKSPSSPGDDLVARWRAAGRRLDPEQVWERHVDAGVGVALRGDGSYPVAFLSDPAPPPILFWRGDPDAVVGTRAAVVGTRRCTRYGRDVAAEIGTGLSAGGVSVVSGLALGIDGAAHRGALAAAGAPPIAVVGSGLDVIYPPQHAGLWAEVAERGVVFSECPLGTAPHPWRFPSRNRLVAALGDALVVVESPRSGGSMHTVREADRRGRPILAVPGPVHSPASEGTNLLLAEGAAVARDATDVLVRLGLEAGAIRSAAEHRRPPCPPAAAVLEALGWQPSTLEQLLVRTGLGVGALAVALEDLVSGGWVSDTGGWYERQAKPGG